MPILFAISTVSAATLGYEILLMRLFSVIQWHHYAYMIISLALLGFGLSGTFLTLARRWLQLRFAVVFVVSAALFGVTALASFSLAQRIPLNPLALIWDPLQLVYLLQIYLVLMLPFFFAGTCIGLALRRFPRRIARLYLYDLVGAGLGALAIVAILFVQSAEGALRLIGAAGVLAGALACLDFELAGLRRKSGLLAVMALALALAWPGDWIAPRISEYKGLSQALRTPGSAVIGESSSPLGLLTVVRSPTVPFRHAPGLSLNSSFEPPAQLGVFTDGDSFTAISRYDGREAPLAYLDDQSQALPYHLSDRPEVLVLGAGGGSEVLRALSHGAELVDAVELNPGMVELVAGTHAEFAGHLYERAPVRVHVAEARSFAAKPGRGYDIIVVSLLDSFTASVSGVHALSENTLYTVEALEDFIRRLKAGGILALTRWLKLPPRDSLKLFATAIDALRSAGVRRPGDQLALIRSWKTTTLLVKNGALTPPELAAIRNFSEARSFDLAYLPGLRAGEANRFNIFHEPYLYTGTKALLGDDRASFQHNYKFDLAPARDDKPFFFHFFKWDLVGEILERPLVGPQLAEWGYLIAIATVIQAAIAGAVLILLPLFFLTPGGDENRLGAKQLAGVAVYFLALGLAFLFIEIAFIQRFTLFLGHPLYAASVVLASFLVFAGLGSGSTTALCQALSRRGFRRAPIPIAIAIGGIGVFSLIHLFALPSLLDELRTLAAGPKIVLAVAFIAPLAFCMGMPFPLGLSWLAGKAPGWIPWVWGINGCASVVAAVLATLIAIHLGFSAVVLIALLIYLTAATVFAGIAPRRS